MGATAAIEPQSQSGCGCTSDEALARQSSMSTRCPGLTSLQRSLLAAHPTQSTSAHADNIDLDSATFQLAPPSTTKRFDPSTAALCSALKAFRPITAHPARLPIGQVFNWSELHLGDVPEREWYGVAFRSLRSPSSGSLSEALYRADALAHDEAKQSQELVMYWYAVPDPETGENLATCIWTSRAAAWRANGGPQHREAVRYAKDAYDKYELERYVVKKRKGESFVTVEPYTGGDVGF